MIMILKTIKNQISYIIIVLQKSKNWSNNLLYKIVNYLLFIS